MASTVFYFDEKGNKQGPISIDNLKLLAENGKIRPDTAIEANGKTYKAGAIKQIAQIFNEQKNQTSQNNPDPFAGIPNDSTFEPAQVYASAPIPDVVVPKIQTPSQKRQKQRDYEEFDHDSKSAFGILKIFFIVSLCVGAIALVVMEFQLFAAIMDEWDGDRIGESTFHSVFTLIAGTAGVALIGAYWYLVLKLIYSIIRSFLWSHVAIVNQDR